MEAKDKRRIGLLIVVLFLPLVLTGFCHPWGPQRIPAASVWERAQDLGDEHGLDPEFIYNIAFAESSFNAHASTSSARGLMQMTRGAWERVTDHPFHLAWDWRRNMVAATAYMDLLRDELEAQERFSYALLAAAYHYGPTRVADNEYDITRLPESSNLVYRAILSGRKPDTVPAPYPDAPVQLPATPEPPPDEPQAAPPVENQAPAVPADAPPANVPAETSPSSAPAGASIAPTEQPPEPATPASPAG